jgi:hypothetical protein
MNNKRLTERLAKIEHKENKYLKPTNNGDLYYKNKIIYNNIHRKLKENKIATENNRLNERIGRL